MDIFGNALDTIIVGALAIPWVLLLYHLFVPDTAPAKTEAHTQKVQEELALSDSRIAKLWKWIKGPSEAAVAGVLLFALAFCLGSIVSRAAQDFFDDSDNLHLWLTETNIRVQVYCRQMAAIGQQKTLATPKPDAAAANTSTKLSAKAALEEQEKDAIKNTGTTCDAKKGSDGDVIFHVHEAALLLQGTDPNERLRQLHDQIMVLRGAAFNGIVAFSLCLFWWSAAFPSSRWRGLALLPYVVLGGISSVLHIRHAFAEPAGPFFFEFSLLILAAAGACLLWRNSTHEPLKEPVGEKAMEARKRRRWTLFGYFFLASLITVVSYMGWWATEVLYDQQVIYSYKALAESPASDQQSKPNQK
jgi:hypothetical protein